MPAFPIHIEDVVDLLDLERSPHSRRGACSFNVKCPFCDDQGYHLNINTEKNVYHCVKCMDATLKSTGVLDLYGRVALGTPLSATNGRHIYRELMSALNRDYPRFSRPQPKKSPTEIVPAPDEKLDLIYSALLGLPYCQLTSDHTNKLLKRGLRKKDIKENGYASMSDSGTMLAQIYAIDCMEGRESELREIRGFFRDNHIRRLIDEGTSLSVYSDSDLILGLKIAQDIIRITGQEPERVPGFFRICGRWSFRSVDKGILIPTRNRIGQIVGLQTRRDITTRKGLRYMTVSSKGLDSGVTTSIARTHFPKGQTLTPDTIVILTEGPLKGDTALLLLDQLGIRNVAFICLQGVNSTRELPEIARYLAGIGISEVKDGFDADKLVNPAVFNAMKTAQRLLRQNGDITLRPLFWNRPYAEQKAKMMESICVENHLEAPHTGNLYTNIVEMALLLTKGHISYDYMQKGTAIIAERWDDATKGIDDYLLSVKSARSLV